MFLPVMEKFEELKEPSISSYSISDFGLDLKERDNALLLVETSIKNI